MVYTFVDGSSVMKKAFLFIGEERVWHPYSLHHFLSYSDLFVFVGELLDDQTRICPKLAEVEINGEILQIVKNELSSRRCYVMP